MIDSVIRKALETRIAAHGLGWLKLRHFELRSAEKKLCWKSISKANPPP